MFCSLSVCICMCTSIRLTVSDMRVCFSFIPPSLCSSSSEKSIQVLPNKQIDQQGGFGNLSMYPSSSVLSDPYRGREQRNMTRCIHKYSSQAPAPQCQGDRSGRRRCSMEVEGRRDWNVDATHAFGVREKKRREGGVK